MVQLKKQLKGYTLPGLITLFQEMGQPRYRAAQLFTWLYNRQVESFEEMLNLPKLLRARLSEEYDLYALQAENVSESNSRGTNKLLFRTREGNFIESVIIPEEKRNTLCVSTQVGCPLDCKFCATGLMGYKKNLTAGEIIDQYLLARKVAAEPITNIVYMGMGEPLLNYAATVASLEILADELATGISLKKVTVSTSGIPTKIKELADSGMRPKLAFSLHSCFEDTRSRIMPINLKYSLKSNMEAVRYYLQKTDTRVTFEYVMLNGINDGDADVRALIRLCKSMPSKVNIIPFNSIAHMSPGGLSAELTPTPHSRIEAFAAGLRDENITVMVRDTRGDDIAAACGQLAVKFI